MTMQNDFKHLLFFRLRYFIILVLAGLLIFHHSLMIYEKGMASESGALTLFDAVQLVFRLSITASLLLVLMGKQWALWAMWLSIGGLVATQYWAHFGNLPVDFIQGRHPLSYLKGFIFPTIITLAFNRSERHGKTQEIAQIS